MGRFYGRVGYSRTVETVPGVKVEKITERKYYGDVLKNVHRHNSTGVNPDVDISNEISIVADSFAFDNFLYIRYVEWMGALWNVSNVEVMYPRLKLSVGGVYNGPEPEYDSASDSDQSTGD